MERVYIAQIHLNNLELTLLAWKHSRNWECQGIYIALLVLLLCWCTYVTRTKDLVCPVPTAEKAGTAPTVLWYT